MRVGVYKAMTSQVIAVSPRVDDAGFRHHQELGADMKNDNPPAYAVGLITVEQINDELFEYMEKVETTIHRFGGQWLSHGRSPDVKEGSLDADVVIIGFPNLDSAHAWYDSDEYQEIIPLRERNCHSVVAIVEGVPTGYTTSETMGRIRGAISAGRRRP